MLSLLLLDSSDVIPVDLVANFPYLRDDRMSEEDKSHYCMKLLEETTAIQSRYVTLVLDLKRSVQKSCLLEDIISSEFSPETF